jgi:hypothetical protein
MDGATYPLGSVPMAGCTTTDALSGVAASATVAVSGGAPDGTGMFTATCGGATDKAGNARPAVTATYTVTRATPPPATTPTTTAALSVPANAAGWHKANVTITFNATAAAGGAPVKQITYSAMGAQAVAAKVTPGATANLTITAQGETTVTYFAEDQAGTKEAARTLVVKLDKTRATCVMGASGTTADGRPYTDMTIRDTGSGLASLTMKQQDNVTPTIPSFAVGTTMPVTLRFTSVDPARPAGWTYDLFDVAGNKTACDPVITTVTVDKGGGDDDEGDDEAKGRQVFRDLPQAESQIRVTNGRPGLRNLTVVVNGRAFRLRELRPGEVRTLDVSSAMRPGNTNTIKLRPHGRPGGSAVVVISDGGQGSGE